MGFECLFRPSALSSNSRESDGLTRSGAFELRRSHIRISGFESSEMAVISFVDYIRLSAVEFQQRAHCLQSTHVLGVPGDRTDSLSAQHIESQTLLLRLDIPHRHEASTAARRQNVWDLFVPVHRLEIIGPGCRRRSQPEGVRHIVEIGDEELRLVSNSVRSMGHRGIIASPLAPAVASNSDLKGLNWRDLIAPLCFEVLDMAEVLLPVSIHNAIILVAQSHLCPLFNAFASHRSRDPFSNAPAMMPSA